MKKLSFSNLFRQKRLTFIFIISIAMTFFQLYTAYFGILPVLLQRSIHVAFALILTFLVKPLKEWKKDLYLFVDISLAVLVFCSALYFILDFPRLISRLQYMSPVTIWDKVFGVITIIAVILATIRLIGVVMPSIALLLIGYCFLGQYMPSFIRHPGISFGYFIEEIFINPSGIYGTPVGFSSTYIFLFILFGTIIAESEIGKTYIDLAVGLVGKMRGGAAKAAVVSSALVGTISGSSVANVYTTGVFTIPLMKKLGYKSDFAGAVEAAASAGGQIMPPIMGAAAFIVAEYVGIRYWELALFAVIPAILYFCSVFMALDLEAGKNGLKGLNKNEVPNVKQTLKKGFINLLPIFSIIYFFSVGYTPNIAAFSAICISILIYILNIIRNAKKSPLIIGYNLLEMFHKGAVKALPIIGACATAGIIITTTMASGLGAKFVRVIMSLSGGNFLAVLVLSMITAILLGMGMPTSGAYIISAIFGVPALIKIGIPPLYAHFFIFYFACFSTLTPPVALAAYAAASIANSNFWSTGLKAVKIGLAGFLLPYLFVFNPHLLGIGRFYDVALSIILGFLALYIVNVGLCGWLFRKLTILEIFITFLLGFMLVTKLSTSKFLIIILLGYALFLLIVYKTRKRNLRIDNKI